MSSFRARGPHSLAWTWLTSPSSSCCRHIVIFAEYFIIIKFFQIVFVSYLEVSLCHEWVREWGHRLPSVPLCQSTHSWLSLVFVIGSGLQTVPLESCSGFLSLYSPPCNEIHPCPHLTNVSLMGGKAFRIASNPTWWEQVLAYQMAQINNCHMDLMLFCPLH